MDELTPEQAAALALCLGVLIGMLIEAVVMAYYATPGPGRDSQYLWEREL